MLGINQAAFDPIGQNPQHKQRHEHIRYAIGVQRKGQQEKGGDNPAGRPQTPNQERESQQYDRREYVGLQPPAAHHNVPRRYCQGEQREQREFPAGQHTRYRVHNKQRCHAQKRLRQPNGQFGKPQQLDERHRQIAIERVLPAPVRNQMHRVAIPVAVNAVLQYRPSFVPRRCLILVQPRR